MTCGCLYVFKPIRSSGVEILPGPSVGVVGGLTEAFSCFRERVKPGSQWQVLNLGRFLAVVRLRTVRE